MVLYMLQPFKKIGSRIIDWILYTLLSDKQKKFLASLFTERQKEKIKRITSIGKQHAQRRLIKQVTDHLYSLGFTKRAYDELTTLLTEHEDDPFMKRLISWELALWHANQITEDDATKALTYLELAKQTEQDIDQLRRIAIIEAECFDLLQKKDQAKTAIKSRLAVQTHPDLYLAMANVEDTIETRLYWINKAFTFYDLQEITFHQLNEKTTYEDLQTKPINKKVQDGPKVSVLLPAYNAEDGIQIAIESILEQTWQNLELIIVDDCSTDETVSIIKQYIKQDNRIKLYSTPENSGPYVARNIGLQHATGEFITVNDSDDWSHAEKIERQVKHLINNPRIIANTSEHARLTEQLKLYRRGTPGRYIFSNMSSLMFRKQPVIQKLGFWDHVRFAADGEFKRRLIRQFGESNIVDLPTGPLSLPRQSVSSLTGSSAFGYNGFFMGVRKEYVESLEYYHDQAKSFYYPYPEKRRPFPVPEPMWPKREKKNDMKRAFDVVVATDFRLITDEQLEELTQLQREVNRIGLVQLYQYDVTVEHHIHPQVRHLIDGEFIQMIVYGETIKANKLFVIDHSVLMDSQRYVPQIDANEIHVFITTEATAEQINEAADQLHDYFGQVGTWYPVKQVEIPSMENSKVNYSNKRLGSLRHYV